MQFNILIEIEKKTKKHSKLKHFDPQKLFLYYLLLNENRKLREELEEKEEHPEDEEIFREVREKDKELGLLEEILKDEDGKKKFEEELEKSLNLKGYYYSFDQEQQKGILAVYYELPEEKKKKDVTDYFLLAPGGMTLIRATQAELGDGVLGVAYLGKNLIKVLDSLYGTDFDEVFRHEVNHILYPHMPEREIRNMTRQHCCYDCKYN